MNIVKACELQIGEHEYRLELGPGERLVLKDLADELARPRVIRVGAVRFRGRSIGRLLLPQSGDETRIVVSSTWSKRAIDSSVDSYCTVRTLVGRIDNSLIASRTLLSDLVREAMSDRACARLDRDWTAEYRLLSVLIERSHVFGSEARAYKDRRELLGKYLNLLNKYTKGRYGIDTTPA